MIFEQKIIKPVRIFKREINHMGHGNDGNNGCWGGYSREQFVGRGCGGRSGSIGPEHWRQGGQVQGVCGGRVRGLYNINKGRYPHVDHSCLSNNIDLNNLTFDDNIWHNDFSKGQSNEIMELKCFCNHNFHLNNVNRGGNYQQQQKYQVSGNYNQYDDNSSVGGLSGSQIFATNKLSPPPRRSTLAPLLNKIALDSHTPLIGTNAVLAVHHLRNP